METPWHLRNKQLKGTDGTMQAVRILLTYKNKEKKENTNPMWSSVA